MVVEEDEKAWCTLTAEANNKVLGKRLGKQLAGVKKALAKLDAAALWPVLEVGLQQCGVVTTITNLGVHHEVYQISLERMYHTYSNTPP